MAFYSVPERLLDPNACLGASQFYETSNMREFKGMPGEPAESARPATSNFYSETSTGHSSYEEEFAWKLQNAEYGISGPSAAGRKNNPHPKETFMVWRFGKEPRDDELKILKEELMRDLCREKIKSTYQDDYRKYHLADEEMKKKLASNLPEDEKSKGNRTLNTTVRVDYRQPYYKGNLNGNTTRYGTNVKQAPPAVGVVPTVVHGSPLLKTSYDTSYTESFAVSDDKINENGGTVDLSKLMEHLSVSEKEVISSMLQSMNNKSKTDSIERISGWDGPSWK